MDYSILATRTPDEQDARLHPTLADAHTIALEPLDGEPICLRASGLLVSERMPDGASIHLHESSAPVDVLVSDARFVVGCAAALAGGAQRRAGWAAVAHVAGGFGRARADHSNGSMLVGQVRYSWLRSVGFRPRRGRGSRGEVRLEVVVKAPDGDSRDLFLDVQLPRGLDSTRVAQAVAMRAARYLLAYADLADERERRSCEELAQIPHLENSPLTEFALYTFPRAPFVSAASAYPATAFHPR